MNTASAIYTAPDDYNLFWASLTNPLTLGLLAVSFLCFLIFIALLVKESVSARKSGETLESQERHSRFTALEVSMAFVILPLSLAVLGFPITMNHESRYAQMENITAKYIVDNLEEVEMSENLLVAEYSTPRYPGPFKMEFNINEETGEPTASFVTDEGAYPVEETQKSILAEITRAK